MGTRLLLDRGHVVFEGSASEAVKRYYMIEQDDRLLSTAPRAGSRDAAEPGASEGPAAPGWWPVPKAFLDLSRVSQVSGGASARCTGVALCDSAGQPCRVFSQGETARVFYEFELLSDIEVPTGGVEVVNEKGTIVHGKTTLEYGSAVPREVRRGSRLRFRQDIALEIAVGEYTFNVGMGTLGREDYDRRPLSSHFELDARFVRLCVLPAAGAVALTVVLRPRGKPVAAPSSRPGQPSRKL